MPKENKPEEQNLRQQLIEAFKNAPVVKITNAKELNDAWEDDDN